MVKKSDHIPDDLVGFKEFIDQQETVKPGRQRRDPNASFELLTFLENESIRLSKAIKLCEDKVHNIKKNPLDLKIIKDQESNLVSQKQALIQKLKKQDSTLSLNLNELLQSHFNS